MLFCKGKNIRFWISTKIWIFMATILLKLFSFDINWNVLDIHRLTNDSIICWSPIAWVRLSLQFGFWWLDDPLLAIFSIVITSVCCHLLSFISKMFTSATPFFCLEIIFVDYLRETQDATINLFYFLVLTFILVLLLDEQGTSSFVKKMVQKIWGR